MSAHDRATDSSPERDSQSGYDSELQDYRAFISDMLSQNPSTLPPLPATAVPNISTLLASQTPLPRCYPEVSKDDLPATLPAIHPDRQCTTYTLPRLLQ